MPGDERSAAARLPTALILDTNPASGMGCLLARTTVTLNPYPQRELFWYAGHGPMDSNPDLNPKRRNTYVLLGRYSAVVFLLPSTVVGGYFVGRWLDGKFETYPWLTLVLVLMGTVAGFVEVFRLLMRK